MTQQSELNLQGIDFEEGYIAVIDKPLEWTSSDVVRKIKFALRRANLILRTTSEEVHSSGLSMTAM